MLDDFDFKRPKADLSARSSIARDHRQSNYEIYDYLGEYQQHDPGESYARTRMEALQSQYEIIRARSDVRALQAGALFRLDHHSREDQNREYLIVSVTHSIQSDAYRSGDQSSASTCINTFTAMDSATPYRPLQQTPKPRVQGPQTAMVVGPAGEEIYTDAYGRVKLQFHWDRYGQANENASCWIRVSQLWVGKGWGGMTIPRIGQEVIVEYLEGDPDRPIVTGRVYNGDHRTPYPLPQFATRSGIKSQSSKGGGGFNEIRFEDKKGEEQVLFHAERNQDVRVKNDSLEWVGHDRHCIIKNDQFEQIEGDSYLTIRGDQNVEINGSISRDIAKDLHEKVGKNHALEAETEIHYKAGKNVVIEAGESITLKAGGGFITIGPAGVTISGMQVAINSGGIAGSGSGCSPEAVMLPMAADDGRPGNIGSPKNTEPKQIKPQPKSTVSVGGYQNPMVQGIGSNAKGGNVSNSKFTVPSTKGAWAKKPHSGLHNQDDLTPDVKKDSFKTIREVDMDNLSVADKDAVRALREQGRNDEEIEQVLSSGNDFRAKELNPGDKLYGFDSSSHEAGKPLDSMYWMDEAGYQGVKEKYYKGGHWDKEGVKNYLALPCYNRADVIDTATVEASHSAVESTIGKAMEQLGYTGDNYSTGMLDKIMGGGGTQITPDKTAISPVKRLPGNP